MPKSNSVEYFIAESLIVFFLELEFLVSINLNRYAKVTKISSSNK